MKYSIHAQAVPEPEGPMSQGTTAGRLVFTSGQIACDPNDSTKLISADIAEQTKRVIELCAAILQEADCSLSDVAKTTIYLADLSDLAQVDEVYGRYFTSPTPARSVIQAAQLPFGALIEMDCVACR